MSLPTYLLTHSIKSLCTTEGNSAKETRVLLDTSTPPKPKAMSLPAMEHSNEQRRRLYHEADVVVVGAGIFGCAAAFILLSYCLLTNTSHGRGFG
jgi:hypothetical protein